MTEPIDLKDVPCNAYKAAMPPKDKLEHFIRMFLCVTMAMGMKDDEPSGYLVGTLYYLHADAKHGLDPFANVSEAQFDSEQEALIASLSAEDEGAPARECDA